MNFELGYSLVDSFVDVKNSNCEMSTCDKINRWLNIRVY